jgi:8-oxo-dGTP pyrophosphatase MutT (NUDIX family)
MEHKAFVNDKPILFLQTYDAAMKPLPDGFHLFSSAETTVEKTASDLEKKNAWKGVIYISETPDESWKEFVSLYTFIEAAGGLVTDHLGRYLFIYRRKKWDLPKGKIDYDESPEEAALREVQEECGISELQIRRTLSSTFHTYPQDGKRYLKKTHWYLMQSDENEKLVPQAEEDIERVEWMSEEKIRRVVYPNTFFSIHELLEDFFGNNAGSS